MDRLLTPLAAYATLAALITITPGVDNFLVLRYAALGGSRLALSAGLGISLGCMVWVGASVLGLAALLATSSLALTLLRCAGAAYLAWLGFMALRRTVRARVAVQDDSLTAAPESGEPVARIAAFRVGLFTNLLNAKAAVFFLSVLPQFLPPGYPTLPVAGLFVVVHLSVGMLWFLLIANLVERARAALNKPVVRLRLEHITGLVFVALAARLALAGA